MAEPKMLPPSMRPPKRYVVYEVVSDQPIVYGELVNTIWTTTMEFLGEIGAAEANIWFVHNTYDSEKQTGVIKCRHGSVEMVRLILSKSKKEFCFRMTLVFRKLRERVASLLLRILFIPSKG